MAKTKYGLRNHILGPYFVFVNRSNKQRYYEALEKCRTGWHENVEDPTSFIKYMLRILLAAYRDFEARVDMVSEKLPSLKIVRKACMQKIGKFTKTDLMALCPTIGKSSVENAIKKLTEEGVLVRHGSGRAVYYTRSDAE